MKSEEYREMRFIDEKVWREGLILPDKGEVVQILMKEAMKLIKDSPPCNWPETLTDRVMNRLYGQAINVDEEEVEK